MGLNSVAVLLNDFVHEMKEDKGEIAKRMAFACSNWNRATLEGYFRVGRVISRDHSSAHQIVVVHGGGGSHIADAKDLPYMALWSMADCLKRHGWTAKPPRKKKRIAKDDRAAA